MCSSRTDPVVLFPRKPETVDCGKANKPMHTGDRIRLINVQPNHSAIIISRSFVYSRNRTFLNLLFSCRSNKTSFRDENNNNNKIFGGGKHVLSSDLGSYYTLRYYFSRRKIPSWWWKNIDLPRFLDISPRVFIISLNYIFFYST